MKAILRMEEEERFCLDASVFCSVCVAYLTWVGPRSLTRRFGAYFLPAKADNSEPGARFIIGNSTNWGGVAHHALLRFIKAWAEIELKVRYANLYVFAADNQDRKFAVPHAIVDHEASEGGRATAETMLLLMPDEAMLAERARQRCMNRQAQGRPMVNINGYMNYISFMWANSRPKSVFDSSTQLFRIKDYAGEHANCYRSVYA
jgi:hypothetical protein